MKLINNPKDFIQVTLIILFLLSPIFLLVNSLYYIDPFRLGFIKLDRDIVRGDKKTIRLAIKDLKKNNKPAYSTLIKYVDRIGEKNCIIADHVTHHQEFLDGLNLPGCYVRGSRTIYLIPSLDTSKKTVKGRADTIGKMVVHAKEYWDKY